MDHHSEFSVPKKSVNFGDPPVGVMLQAEREGGGGGAAWYGRWISLLLFLAKKYVERREYLYETVLKF